VMQLNTHDSSIVFRRMFFEKKPRTVACGLPIGMASILDALLPRWSNKGCD
jgi:hypothetical protein